MSNGTVEIGARVGRHMRRVITTVQPLRLHVYMGAVANQCIDISAAIGVQNRKSTASLKLVNDKPLRQLSSSLSYLFTFQQIIQQTYYDISGGRLPQKPSGSLVWPPIVYHTYTPV